jgi:hypothetical protein
MTGQPTKRSVLSGGFLKTTFCIVLICLIAVSAGCGAQKPDPNVESIVITSLAELDNETFSEYTNLKTLDLRAVAVEAARVDEIQTIQPNCDILWNVPLGSSSFDNKSSEITLPQDCAAADLQLLKYFSALSRVDATACTVDEAFADAAAAFPAVSFVWNTTFGGVSIKSTDTVLDLTGIQSLSPELLNRMLPGLPALEKVICSGTGWSAEQIAALKEAHPAIEFVYDVAVFGDIVPYTTQTPVSYTHLTLPTN